MAIISAGKASKSALNSMKYVEFEKHSKNIRAIMTAGIHCSNYYKDAAKQFKQLANAYQKTGGREAHHMVLSFSDNEMSNFTPETLMDHSITIAEHVFPNHQIWLGMHTDTDHLHVHLIINATNFETGKKLQIAQKQGMYQIMNKVQEQCVELGLDSSIVGDKQEKNIGDMNTRNLHERRVIKNNNSWKRDLATDIYSALLESNSKQEFIQRCKELNIKCEWSDNRQHVLFYPTCAPSKKVRNTNLAKTFTLPQLSSKENMFLYWGEKALLAAPKEVEIETAAPTIKEEAKTKESITRPLPSTPTLRKGVKRKWQ